MQVPPGGGALCGCVAALLFYRIVVSQRRMRSPNEFWLCLHQLAESYESEGLTPEERAAKITQQFATMPRIAQQQVRDRLAHLALALPDLYPLIMAAANRDRPKQSDAG